MEQSLGSIARISNEGDGSLGRPVPLEDVKSVAEVASNEMKRQLRSAVLSYEQKPNPPLEKRAINDFGEEEWRVTEELTERIDPNKLPEQLKWILTMNPVPKGSTPEERAAYIKSHTRGISAEIVSGFLPLDTCACLYPRNFEQATIEDLRIVSTDIYNGDKAKAYYLRGALQRRLQYRITPDIGQDLGISTADEGDVVLDTADKVIDSLIESTVLPDALIMGYPPAKNSCKGAVEIKGYKPQEVRDWVDSIALRNGDKMTADIEGDVQEDMTLGLNALGLLKFAYYMRAGYEDDFDAFPMPLQDIESLKRNFVLVLRFPADAPHESLQTLGKYMNYMGYEKVLIQRLPLSSSELEDLGVDILAKHQDRIHEGGLERAQFSKKDITAIDTLVEERQHQTQEPIAQAE